MQELYLDLRWLNSADNLEREAKTCMNPYGPARPPSSQRPEEPPTGRDRLRKLWSRLRAVWPLKRKPQVGARAG